MGSRAVVVVCRDAEVGRARASASTAARRRVYTRTGRRFFDDATRSRPGASLERVLRPPSTAAGPVVDELDTDWLRARLRADAVVGQGAGAAARASTRRSARRGAGLAAASVAALAAGRRARPRRRGALLERPAAREPRRRAYLDAYRRYCWPRRRRRRPASSRRSTCWRAEGGVLRRAATTPGTSTTLDALAAADLGWLVARPAPARRRRPIRTRRGGRDRLVGGADRRAAARAWWSSRCDFIAPRTQRASSSPGVKCRGREYLRIIYGPEYTAPENLERLRKRGARPQAIARAARVRARDRGARALRARASRCTACTSACSRVLALESEPVDPRL